MSPSSLAERLAELAVGIGANVQPGQIVTISADLGLQEVVREVAAQNKADAVIACGVILQGETNHAQNLSRSVTDALQRIAVEQAVPVINVVLCFDNEDQARVRCLEDRINRGTEAARAAVEIANVVAELRRR